MTLRGVTAILKHRATEAKAKANIEQVDEVKRQAPYDSINYKYVECRTQGAIEEKVLSQLDIETEVEQHIKMLESAPRSADVLARARFGVELPEDKVKHNQTRKSKTSL